MSRGELGLPGVWEVHYIAVIVGADFCLLCQCQHGITVGDSVRVLHWFQHPGGWAVVVGWYRGPDGVMIQWLYEVMVDSGKVGSDHCCGDLGGGGDKEFDAGLL